MDVLYHPATLTRAHQVDRLHLHAIATPQLDPERHPLRVAPHRHGTLDDPVGGVVQIALHYGEPFVQLIGGHPRGSGASLVAPELRHRLDIGESHGVEKAGHRVRGGRGSGGRRRGAAAARRREDSHMHGQSSGHGLSCILWGTIRR